MLLTATLELIVKAAIMPYLYSVALTLSKTNAAEVIACHEKLDIPPARI